ncbi:hypothetical protein RUM43_011331 [Polyplax serrata]|uniref:Uncharacterized protein n=1 Tax=Polyplax serrata TaxID=468196 RepID=A0AAN8PUG4_POLSC
MTKLNETWSGRRKGGGTTKVTHPKKAQEIKGVQVEGEKEDEYDDDEDDGGEGEKMKMKMVVMINQSK